MKSGEPVPDRAAENTGLAPAWWSGESRWCVEITGALQTQDNRLEIEVTNLLPNRMIGDEQLPPETDYQRGANHVVTSLPSWLTGSAPRNSRRYTFSTFNPYTKDSPLLASGLLGPVVLRYEPPRN